MDKVEIGIWSISILAMICLVVVMVGVLVVTEAYAFCDLWTWFLVPLGVPAIGKLHALGIATLLYVPVIGISATMMKSKEWYTLLVYEGGLLASWLSGYIIHGMIS